MNTVAILPIAEPNGETSYQATLGNTQSIGKTAGQALDALVAQMDEPSFKGLLVIQSFQPDALFTQAQQTRLLELMTLWRDARDQGKDILPEQQAELDRLVELELDAATARTTTLIEQVNE
ncbi:MAG: hypothetical protein F6K09_04005 [Merismopedia sp. SIO2A8]|nr:hypothetical protein [Merismopedia sp. SIO2A8]